jgi:hypothetical protein
LRKDDEEREVGRCPYKKKGDPMRQTYKQLEKKGWLRQFVADESQAKDAAEIYDLLGYEVYLQPPIRRHFRTAISSKEKSRVQCQIVYIRPKR